MMPDSETQLDASAALNVPRNADDTPVIKFAPDIVIEAEPVLAKFRLDPELTVPEPEEKAVEILPSRRPEVKIRRMLRKSLRAARHPITVSDIQMLRSQPVPPVTAEGDHPVLDILDPTTLITKAPVTGLLLCRLSLMETKSAETARERLPTRYPLESNTVRQPISICDVLPINAVSDIHHDPLTELRPILDTRLCDTLPNPDPINVTLTDPVAATFLGGPKLFRLTSCENNEDTLPISRLIVTDSR